MLTVVVGNLLLAILIAGVAAIRGGGKAAILLVVVGVIGLGALAVKGFADPPSDKNDVMKVVVAIQGDVTTIKDGVETVKGDVAALKGDVDAVKGDVTMIKADVATIKGDATALKTDMGAVKNGVAMTKNDLAKVEAVTKHEPEKFAAADYKLDQLSNQISGLKIHCSSRACKHQYVLHRRSAHCAAHSQTHNYHAVRAQEVTRQSPRGHGCWRNLLSY
jgi:hypothetical protein